MSDKRRIHPQQQQQQQQHQHQHPTSVHAPTPTYTPPQSPQSHPLSTQTTASSIQNNNNNNNTTISATSNNLYSSINNESKRAKLIGKLTLQPNDHQKRHPLFLSFTDMLLEKEFFAFVLSRERKFIMAASFILILFDIAMIIVACASIPSLTIDVVFGWIIPQIILVFIHTHYLILSYRNDTTANYQTSIIIILILTFLVRPLWIALWQSSSSGPSAVTLILQCMSLMLYPSSLKTSFWATMASLSSLYIACILLIFLQTTSSGIALPVASNNRLSGWDGRFAWASALVLYTVAAGCSWAFARNKQRALRRLFLLTKRKANLQGLLKGQGLSSYSNIGGSSGTTISKSVGTLALQQAYPLTSKNAVIHEEDEEYMAEPREQKMYVENGTQNPPYTNNRPQSAAIYKSRPQTAISISNSIKEDWDGPMSRPGTAGGTHTLNSSSRNFTNMEDAFAITKSSKHGSEKSVFRKSKQASDPSFRGWSLVLGQQPWSYNTERRYLRSQARLNIHMFIITLVSLVFLNMTVSILDHYDRIRIEGATLDQSTLISRFLVQIIPTTAIPLVGLGFVLLFRKYNLFLWIQPLVLLVYSGITAAYLLSPMEVLSTVYPDSFPQSKETAYLILICILHSQSGIVPPRSFTAWCIAVIFLCIMHIPLVFSWGGNFDSRMPWGMFTAVTILVILLAAFVRFMDSLAREGYETMQELRISMRLIHMSKNQVEESFTEKKNTWHESEGIVGLGITDEGSLDEEYENERTRSMSSLFDVYAKEHPETTLNNTEPVLSSSIDRLMEEVLPGSAAQPNTTAVIIKPKRKMQDKLNDLLVQCDQWIADDTTAGDVNHEEPIETNAMTGLFDPTLIPPFNPVALQHETSRLSTESSNSSLAIHQDQDHTLMPLLDTIDVDYQKKTTDQAVHDDAKGAESFTTDVFYKPIMEPTRSEKASEINPSSDTNTYPSETAHSTDEIQSQDVKPSLIPRKTSLGGTQTRKSKSKPDHLSEYDVYHTQPLDLKSNDEHPISVQKEGSQSSLGRLTKSTVTRSQKSLVAIPPSENKPQSSDASPRMETLGGKMGRGIKLPLVGKDETEESVKRSDQSHGTTKKFIEVDHPMNQNSSSSIESSNANTDGFPGWLARETIADTVSPRSFDANQPVSSPSIITPTRRLPALDKQ